MHGRESPPLRSCAHCPLAQLHPLSLPHLQPTATFSALTRGTPALGTTAPLWGTTPFSVPLFPVYKFGEQRQPREAAIETK